MPIAWRMAARRTTLPGPFDMGRHRRVSRRLKQRWTSSSPRARRAVRTDHAARKPARGGAPPETALASPSPHPGPRLGREPCRANRCPNTPVSVCARNRHVRVGSTSGVIMIPVGRCADARMKHRSIYDARDNARTRPSDVRRAPRPLPRRSRTPVPWALKRSPHVCLGEPGKSETTPPERGTVNSKLRRPPPCQD